MASDIINNSYAIGIAGKNLILQTAGRVYVKKQDKYYELDFGSKSVSRSGEETPQLPDIIIVNSEDDILNMPYPGDGKVIIGRDGSLYITIDGQLVKWEPDCNCGGGSGELSGDTIINGQLTVNYPDGSPIIINGDPNVPPFIINSRELVYNLNAEFLNGFSSDEFARKVANEIITGTWTFGDIILNGSLGDGWTVLDIANSTLDIDYINVRKGIKWPAGMDPFEDNDPEYKIFGTNEETWVGKEFFLENFYPNGGNYLAQVKNRNPETDLNLPQYIRIGSVVKSEIAVYQVISIEEENIGLSLISGQLPEDEDEKKLVVVQGLGTGAIVMDGVGAESPYISVRKSYNGNNVVKVGNINGTVGASITGDQASSISVILESSIGDKEAAVNKLNTSSNNITITNPSINWESSGVLGGSARINPDGSGYFAGGNVVWGSSAMDSALITDGFLHNCAFWQDSSSNTPRSDSRVYFSGSSILDATAGGREGRITKQFEWNREGLTFKGNDTNPTYQFNPDGSGKIGQFTWDANGTAIATTSRLGTVKVGNGLRITADGTLSVDSTGQQWSGSDSINVNNQGRIITINEAWLRTFIINVVNSMS